MSRKRHSRDLNLGLAHGFFYSVVILPFSPIKVFSLSQYYNFEGDRIGGQRRAGIIHIESKRLNQARAQGPWPQPAASPVSPPPG